MNLRLFYSYNSKEMIKHKICKSPSAENMERYIQQLNNTCNEHSALSVTGIPPKSKARKFAKQERSFTPSVVNPVSDINSFSKLVVNKTCLIPASVTLEHLDKSNSFKLLNPNNNQEH